MKVRWLVMLLSANTGGWTGLVTVLGRADSKALAFYRKAVDGRLTTLTPHTEEFKTTVTSSGIKNFEGVVEGQLISPCEFEPAPGIEFLQNNMAMLEHLNASNMVKDWRTECRGRLHGDRNEKNLWVGVLLGIVKNSQTYLCHTSECGGHSETKKINLADNTWSRSTFELAFKIPGGLTKDYKLKSVFFKRLFYETKGSQRGNFKRRDKNGKNGEVKIFGSEILDNGKLKASEICQEDGRFVKEWGEYNSKKKLYQWGNCEEWVESINKAKKIYVIDARSDDENGDNYEGNWWENVNKRGSGNNNPLKFWWWWASDPDNQNVLDNGGTKKRIYEEVKKYWLQSKSTNEVCIPIPAMLRKKYQENTFDMTIEAIRCGQKEIKILLYYYVTSWSLKKFWLFQELN